jgi:hypothetical protein
LKKSRIQAARKSERKDLKKELISEVEMVRLAERTGRNPRAKRTKEENWARMK